VDAEASHPFLRACRRQPTEYTPVWLMRQAGRYLPEYRAMRERLSLLDLCKTPEAAAEVTVLAVEKLGVDAAIIFADILLVAEPMGVGLRFARGEGPVIERPVRTREDVARLRDVDPQEGVPYVFEAVRLARRALGGRVPLIGFAGAPFTLASYLVEGGASRQFLATKRLMHTDPETWDALMEKLVRVVSRYLAGQIASGCGAVQLFDSWAGCLSPDAYRRFVLPYTRRVVSALPAGAPVIHFGTGTAGLLELMREAGGDVIGVDWRVDLGEAWRRLGEGVAVQGNLDPALLLTTPGEIRDGVRRVLAAAAGRPGHIFNLGHGILPGTPVDTVRRLADFVHEKSAKK
jgi:uroporphyrinogen decarboxylase